MKRVLCTVLVAMALILASPLPGQARHHARFHFGAHVWLGPGFWWGSPFWWGPPFPYSYPSPPVVIQQEQPVVVEPAPQPSQYWYYCQNPQGYYPYVQQCPSGWMTVVPPTTPPAATPPGR